MREHIENGILCWCKPTIEYDETGFPVLVIHNDEDEYENNDDDSQYN